jgi:endonuclease-3
MNNKELLKKNTKIIIKKLKDKYGELECFLTHKNAFELLCAVCLSAQCTDDRVNMVTPGLFKAYPAPRNLAEANLKDVEKIIKSCGFYKNKAKNLIKMAQSLVIEHDSQVPDRMDKLVKLAGVGRKTANVVLGNWFKKSEGVVVDTHVKRLVNLLGLTNKNDPVKIEQDLNILVPKKYWDNFSLWLIAHGRETCVARRPSCSRCLIKKYCNYAQIKNNN